MGLKKILKVLLEPVRILKMAMSEKLHSKKFFYKRKLPIELQFPITYKCNFDCVMCGMHNLIGKSHMDAKDIKEILSDSLFKKVQSVGINGGEPFLRTDLSECIEAVITSLPELKVVSIISNGYCTDKIVKDLPVIKKMCKEHQVRLQVSFSLDGVDEMQDFMRGRQGAYEHLMETIHKISENRELYCDSLMMICTITKYNIYKIYDVENWAKQFDIEVSYNVATINKRIANEDRVSDFSVFSDEQARMLTQEFFYKKYYETGNEKYYGLFLFVSEGKRYAYCPYMYSGGVTLTPDGSLCYCATHSDILGSAKDKSAHKMFMENDNYHRSLCNEKCDSCSHYIYSLNSKGKKRLKREKDNQRTLVLLPKLRRKV